MEPHSYIRRRNEIESYFDGTAFEAWKRLTSEAPLGRIRQTVRAGREEMRKTLLSWLPEDLRGVRILDAGCGTGVLAQEAAARGADVTATDLSKSLIEIAQNRRPKLFGCGQLEFVVGDMLELDVGTFDYVVAMDSLIHYAPDHMIAALAKLSQKARRGVLFTYAPKTPALAVMHAIGRAFPRSDRAPAIEPISSFQMEKLLESEPKLSGWYACRTKRIASGFYKSQAMELLAE
ncbi:magnesium protoporphyrin IX methyltransferase [Hyphomicrobium sp.]|uniref:magnesium protoporphyrin IX methyltransferase n=1 Tax=Hyphomicrobium sp. TaxID=82 RepID=UPI000F91B97E|nr:magnesium protoporphyrin IX methyltransferase [Hyphomicrobium sp.]RUP00563.1 MAG: magnesium protoporphyrin IX methyltransferase [Hyphomicrobium sp.]